MALEIDTSRDFRTPSELAALVKAVAEAPAGTQEKNWIEWKSSLDLNSAEGRFTVAKAILGFSNRSPAVAAQACRGSAYLIIGAEPGNVVGMPQIDHANLSQKIARYAEGPRWDAHDVDYEGKNVLVIEIRPPEPGDRIYSLQRALDPAFAGMIYHRSTAQTEPAGPKVIEMLQDRLLGNIASGIVASEPEIELDMDVNAEPLIRLDVNSEAVEEWLEEHEKYIRATIKPERPVKPDPPPRPPSEKRGPAAAFMPSMPEASSILGSFEFLYTDPKDAREFDQRVEKYIRVLRKRLLSNVIQEMTMSSTNDVYFTVTNNTVRPIVGVQLTASLRVDDIIIHETPHIAEALPPFPRWPSPAETFMAQNVRGSDIITRQAPGLLASGPEVITRGDRCDLTWEIGDLRPGRTERVGPITILAGPRTRDEIPVTLTGRAMNRQGTATDSKSIDVMDDALVLEDYYEAAPETESGPGHSGE